MIPSRGERAESTPAPQTTSIDRRTVLRGVAIGAAAGLVAAPTGSTPASAAPIGSGPASAAVGQVPPPVQLPAVTLDGPPLLCEPYLLDPAACGVRVLWHTEDPGIRQVVLVGGGVAAMTGEQAVEAATGTRDRSGDPGSAGGWRRFPAVTRQLTRTREDAASQVPGRSYAEVQSRPVYSHLAEVQGIPGGRTPYRVVSIDSTGRATVTSAYSLAPALPATGSARLLLTSDHQLKTMVPANLAAVARTVGVELDGVLMAGDCVNVPDRASDWFDSAAGVAFFANLTGRAAKTIGGYTYQGAPLVQHTPIFPAIGNHEVMGRYSTIPLTAQFNDPQPTAVAERRWEQTQPFGVDRAAWVTDHSWNVTTYEQMFPYPRSAEGGPRWYARRIGEVFLVSLFVTAVWRPAAATGTGKFQETPGSVADPGTWGHGQFVFEPIQRGSRQYDWLSRTLRSRAARAARYRVVMFHHPSHGLGDNSAPALTDPVQAVTFDPATGTVAEVTYSYPLAQDQVLRDVEPLVNETGVNLVLTGHSHVWNRFRNAAGVNWLETSNVGNTYGAFDVSSGASRSLPASADHVLQGDPGGLTPVVPTVAPLTGPTGAPLPYVASNDYTVFSILDSGPGTVRSYRFDTRDPQSTPQLFDEFPLR